MNNPIFFINSTQTRICGGSFSFIELTSYKYNLAPELLARNPNLPSGNNQSINNYSIFILISHTILSRCRESLPQTLPIPNLHSLSP